MCKHALAASFAVAALSIAGPAHAGPLGKSPFGAKQWSTASIFSRLNLGALNPQPLPPRWNFSSALNAKALNPQPLPPRWNSSIFGSNVLSTKALNPQPLPPLQLFGSQGTGIAPRIPPASKLSRTPPLQPMTILR